MRQCRVLDKLGDTHTFIKWWNRVWSTCPETGFRVATYDTVQRDLREPHASGSFSFPSALRYNIPRLVTSRARLALPRVDARPYTLVRERYHGSLDRSFDHHDFAWPDLFYVPV